MPFESDEDLVMTVYRRMLLMHLWAAQEGNHAIRRRIFDAIQRFEELFPDECATFRGCHGRRSERDAKDA